MVGGDVWRRFKLYVELAKAQRDQLAEQNGTRLLEIANLRLDAASKAAFDSEVRRSQEGKARGELRVGFADC